MRPSLSFLPFSLSPHTYTRVSHAPHAAASTVLSLARAFERPEEEEAQDIHSPAQWANGTKKASQGGSVIVKSKGTEIASSSLLITKIS